MSIRAALVDALLAEPSISSLIQTRVYDDFYEFEDFLNQKANSSKFPAIAIETGGDEQEEKLSGHNQLNNSQLIVTCLHQIHLGKMRSRSASVKAKQKTLLREIDTLVAAVKAYLNNLLGSTLSGIFVRKSHVVSIVDGTFDSDDNRRIITKELSFSVIYS